jgi:DNA-binding Lrp family transcriptional regulator
MQESDRLAIRMPESTDPSEIDLALLGALEVNPRADWASVGAALDLSPTTVARRWAALSAAGDAWVTIAPGRRFVEEAGCAFAFLAVEPAHLESAIVALAASPFVATMSRVTGEYDLMIDCFGADMTSLFAEIGTAFASVPGILRTEVLVATRVHRHGTQWRSGTIARDQARNLQPHRVASAGRRRVEVQLVEALTRDGRLSWEQLGAVLGHSAQTARRQTDALLGRGILSLRCDRARRFDAAQREASFLVSVPAPRLEDAARLFAALPSCRLSAEVLGSVNLVATLWVRDLAELQRIEADLVDRVPEAIVRERTLSMRTDKRLGHVLDASGRSTGVVPIVFPS